MIGGASNGGELVQLTARRGAGVATNATEEAFSGFLANWKRLDEKTPQDGFNNESPGSERAAPERRDPIVVGAGQESDSPSNVVHAIDPTVAVDAPRALSAQSFVGSVTRTASGPAPSLKIDHRFLLTEAKNVTRVTNEGNRSEHLDPLLRFEWRKTAAAGIWSGDGLSLTLRDYGIADSDGERLLSAVRSMLSGQSVALNRLTVNGKNLFQR